MCRVIRTTFCFVLICLIVGHVLGRRKHNKCTSAQVPGQQLPFEFNIPFIWILFFFWHQGFLPSTYVFGPRENILCHHWDTENQKMIVFTHVDALPFVPNNKLEKFIHFIWRLIINHKWMYDSTCFAVPNAVISRTMLMKTSHQKKKREKERQREIEWPGWGSSKRRKKKVACIILLITCAYRILCECNAPSSEYTTIWCCRCFH